MDIFKRSLAPVSSEAWEEIEEEAKDVLDLKLTGRKVVDLKGPYGLDFAAVNNGRSEAIDGEVGGVEYKRRLTTPAVEIKVPFTLEIEELDKADRGAPDVELDPVIDAADKLAAAENSIIFHGQSTSGLEGIISASEHETFSISDQIEKIMSQLARAKEKLFDEDIGGPYSLLLSPELFTCLFEYNDRGYPVQKRIASLLGNEPLHVPGLESNGVLMPQNSDDFELFIGQDTTIGYEGVSDDKVELYLFESLSFRINAPEAAVVLD